MFIWVACIYEFVYTRRMTAQIISFPARPATMPMPPLEAWLEEVDDFGPEPTAFAAEMLLRRVPDPGHEVAAWLAGFVRRPMMETS